MQSTNVRLTATEILEQEPISLPRDVHTAIAPINGKPTQT
jgi:hypothetical protein